MLFSALDQRRLQPEIMDQPGLGERQHIDALNGLRRINVFSGSAGILWRPIRALARERGFEPLRLLDLATGSGDVPIRLCLKARRAGVDLRAAACDVNPQAIRYAAQRATQCNAPVDFFPLDAVRDAIPAGFDIITSSLFLHHLETEQAVSLLRRAAEATRTLVLINDLVRCRAGYALAFLGTRLLSRSPVVHVDGPRSVEGAFTRAEAAGLARQAGLEGATVARRWPFRFLLTWRKG
ncbi:MAG: methyltransferase domain-containing protein [Gemmataceae bacterium]|nr:methyltransferase domain-containing protein [Gemmataceae bacterium]